MHLMPTKRAAPSVCSASRRLSPITREPDSAPAPPISRRTFGAAMLAASTLLANQTEARDSGDWYGSGDLVLSRSSLALMRPRLLARTTPGLAEPEDKDMPKFVKLPSGVIIQDLISGTGEREARFGDKILLDFVLRRANGYFIYVCAVSLSPSFPLSLSLSHSLSHPLTLPLVRQATVEGVSFQPQDVPTGAVNVVLDDSLLPGLVEGIQGMRKGGRRRILVPPEVGYLAGSDLAPKMPTFATSRQLANHRKEPLVFELEIVNIQ